MLHKAMKLIDNRRAMANAVSANDVIQNATLGLDDIKTSIANYTGKK